MNDVNEAKSWNAAKSWSPLLLFLALGVGCSGNAANDAGTGGAVPAPAPGVAPADDPVTTPATPTMPAAPATGEGAAAPAPGERDPIAAPAVEEAPADDLPATTENENP